MSNRITLDCGNFFKLSFETEMLIWDQNPSGKINIHVYFQNHGASPFNSRE